MASRSPQSFVMEFVQGPGKRFVPLLKKLRSQQRPWKDLTRHFHDVPESKMIAQALARKNRVYGVLFSGCRGLAEKWVLTRKGNLARNDDGRPIIQVSPYVVSVVPLDLSVPFISSDEILPVNARYRGPYGLKPGKIAAAMRAMGANPKRDLLYLFVCSPREVSFRVNRFLGEFLFIAQGGYLHKKGFLSLDGPQWREYFQNEELSELSKLFLSGAVDGLFDAKRLSKLRLEKRARLATA